MEECSRPMNQSYESNNEAAALQRSIQNRCVHPSGVFSEFREEDVEQSIVERFEKTVRLHADRPAVKTPTRELTYAELDRAANRVAHAIMGRAGSSTEPVALLFENGAPYVVASLAALKAGRVQVPLESTFPRARLDYSLTASGAALIVTDRGHLGLAAELSGVPVLDIEELDGCPETAPGLRLPADADIALEFSSGSTGQPKGIVRDHRGVLQAIRHFTNISRMCPEDRLAMLRASMRSYLYALLNGATYYPVNLRREDLTRLGAWLERERVTVFRSAVSTFRTWVTTFAGNERLVDLRLISLYGEPVYRSDVALYRKHFPERCILSSSLGCTEFGDYAYIFADRETELTGSVLPAGYPVEGTEVLLLDEQRRPVSVDEVGEFAIRSRYGAVRYWHRPDLTDAAFLPDPNGGGRIYRTGDLGRRGSDGCLCFVGRRDFQIKIRGHRVDVEEVETVLLGIDGVRQAAVIGREEGPGEMSLAAYLVPEGPDPPEASRLRRAVAAKLPEYMVPSVFVTLAAMPLTANGKIDRRALPAATGGVRPLPETAFVAPRTPVEEKLAEIWRAVLKIDRVGVDDDFLELGGQSIAATRVISRMSEEYGLQLPVSSLFEAPTIAELAQLVVRRRGGSAR